MKEARNTVCFFCSLGCGLTINCGEEHIHYQPAAANELEYQLDNPINRGSLCGKCNYIFELMSHPKRIAGPQITAGGKLKSAQWETTVSSIAEAVSKAVSTYGAEHVGIMISPQVTVEEAEQIISLAKLIGTPHVDYCALEDKPILAQIQHSAAFQERLPEVRNIEKMQTVLAVGDVFGLSPVLSRHILRAKYERRANRFIVIESAVSNTSWFADVYLQVNPGTEVFVLIGILKLVLEKTPESISPRVLGASAEPLLNASRISGIEAICSAAGITQDKLQMAANLLLQGNPSLVAMASGFGVYERADLVTGCCQALAAASDSFFLPVLTGANSRGVYEVLRSFRSAHALTASQMIEAIEKGSIKVLLNFGIDVVRTFPGKRAGNALKQLDFLVSTAVFPNDTTIISNAVLPAAPWTEDGGTVVNMFGMRQEFSPVMPPPGYIKTTRDIALLLSEALKQSRIAGSGEKSRVSPSSRDPDFSGLGFAGAGTVNKKDPAIAGSDISENGSRIAGKEIKELFEKYSAPADGQKVLIGSFDFVHSGDGSITQYLNWSRIQSPEPVAVVAGDGKNVRGKKIRISANGQDITVPVKVSRRAKPNVVAVPMHFPQVRNLIGWEMLPHIGYLNVKPVKVTVEYI